MSTCKDCEHYEFYNGPDATCEGGKAVMKCTSVKRRLAMMEGGLPYYGIYAKITSQIPCRFFTAEKEVERKRCGNCRLVDINCLTHIGPCTNYDKWQPIEKPAQATPEEKLEQYNKACKQNRMRATLELETARKEFERKFNSTNKAKENKMFKFSIRRYVMLCTVIVTAKIAILLNPVVSLWDRVIPGSGEDVPPYLTTACNWFFTILAIAAIVAAIYAFNKATAWLFSKMEK